MSQLFGQSLMAFSTIKSRITTTGGTAPQLLYVGIGIRS